MWAKDFFDVCNDKKVFSWSDIEMATLAFKPEDTRRVFKKGAKNLQPSAFLGLEDLHLLGPTFCVGFWLSQHMQLFAMLCAFQHAKSA